MAKQTFELDINQAGAKRALDLIDNARTKLRAFANEAKSTNVIADRLGEGLDDAFANDTSRRVDELTKRADKLNERLKDTSEAAKTAKKDVKALAEEELNEQAAQSSGGGGGKNSALSKFGRELKGLPAVQIPGLGISTDAIGKISQLLGTLPPVALGLSASVTAAGVAVAVLVDRTNKLKDAAKADLDARSRAIGFIQTASQEELDAKIAELKEKRRINEAIAADAAKVLADFRAQSFAQLGSAQAGLQELNAVLGTNSPELIALKDNAAESAKALTETTTELDLLTQASEGGAVALNGYAEALAETRKQAQIAANQATLQAGKDAAAFTNLITKISDLNAQSAEERLVSIGKEQAAIQAELSVLQADKTPIQDPALAARIKELQKSLADLAVESQLVTTAITGTIAAQEAEAEALKKQKDLATATKKYNEDVIAIEDRANKARASAQERYNNALVSAAENAADAAEKALQKLEQERGKIAQGFARNEADEYRKASQDRNDLVMDAQREEAKSARAHAKELLQIQKDAQEQEQGLIDARDFAALFDLRRETTKKINEANAQYDDERRERQIALNDNLTDLATSYQRERENRLIKYQQDLADASAQYQLERTQIEQKRRKDLADAAATYQKELTLANQKYRAELDARNQAIRAELQLINQGGAARIAAEAAIQKALVNQAYAILKNIGAPSSTGGGGVIKPTASAFGNTLSTGQLSTVNELPGQRERFGGQMLPGGAGLFMPLKSGRVSPGSSGGINVNITIPVTGGVNNTQQMVGVIQAAAPQIKTLIIETMAEALGA